jgi:anti-sigma-K factor RskA
MIFWNIISGELFISAAGLPEPPYGKQYQLWAIVDGKPVNAGMLVPQGNLDLLRMETIPKAEMFAITMEHVGGSPVPTLDQMVVAGKPG